MDFNISRLQNMFFNKYNITPHLHEAVDLESLDRYQTFYQFLGKLNCLAQHISPREYDETVEESFHPRASLLKPRQEDPHQALMLLLSERSS